MNPFRTIFLLIIINCTSHILQADTLIIRPNDPRDKFYQVEEKHWKMLKDPYGKMTFEEVRDLPFHKLPKEQVNEKKEFVFSPDYNGVYWFQFILLNQH